MNRESKNPISKANFEDARETLERMQEDFYTLTQFFKQNAPNHVYERLKAYGLGYVDQGLNVESSYVGRVYSLEEALNEMNPGEMCEDCDNDPCECSDDCHIPNDSV